MNYSSTIVERVRQAVQGERLVQTAVKLISIPSRTGEAKAVSDCLADMLASEGFSVERPVGDHPTAPAVAVRWDTGQPGKTVQFNGHLDTVHLPFVPPTVADGRITGSGSSDMKGGVAAMVEALRVVRETGAMPRGSILLTAHDLHESPWGDNHQLQRLIETGFHGDVVLIPEYLTDRLPIVGRGGLNWRVVIARQGPAIHEVMRPQNEPSVIAAAAELVARLNRLNESVARKSDPLAGPESVFIGQIHSGEIYNQYPHDCWIEGTRRWLPGTRIADVENELRQLCDALARDTGTTVTSTFALMRDAFQLDQNDFLVAAFQQAYGALAGQPLPIGAKPFCDDGNTFWALAGIPAITHGPLAGGPHTLNEWVSIDDLVRVAQVYALTACAYNEGDGP
ncbi:MAG: M20 family metallopeptidase [Gemmataceae bacterium]